MILEHPRASSDLISFTTVPGMYMLTKQEPMLTRKFTTGYTKHMTTILSSLILSLLFMMKPNISETLGMNCLTTHFHK